MKTVQEAIYTILSSDITLQTLLGGSATNKKINPSSTDRFESFPMITFEVDDGDFNSVPRNTGNLVLKIHILNKTSKSYGEDIYTRVNALLNYYQDITPTIIYMRNIGNTDVPESDRQLFHKLLRYQIWCKP